MSLATSTTIPPPAVLHDIDWKTYSRLLRAFEGRRRFRLTYDRGVLEIRASRLLEHEGPACLLGRFVDALTEEFILPCRDGGSVTLRRRKKQRGLESDGCFWIASAARLQGKTTLDLRIDPPPDLAIEVDVTSSSLDRKSIYSALGVPEVWRLADSGFTFQVLVGKKYEERTHSPSFPRLASADLVPFLVQQGQTDDTTIVRQLREWVRQNLLAGQGNPPSP